MDDHPAVGEGTRAILESEGDMEADVLHDGRDISELLKEKSYDVYLIDLYMPNVNGIECTKSILKDDPDASVLIYTGFDVISHFNLLVESGVVGFVSKTATKEQLITAIRCALRGDVVLPLTLVKQLKRVSAVPVTGNVTNHLSEVVLSEKEQQILESVAKGLTNKAIATNLSMSQRTIEYNLTKIFSKLDVSSRTEALVKAKELGLLSQQDMNN